jgi:3-hydroxybutyryl-CoA dehydratase
MNKPKEYKISSIKIGQKEQFEITVTESMVNKFAEISGDFNPLHMDEIHAKNTIFGKRVCHGMLISSFLSQLVGMYLPGKNSLYFSQSLKFMSPCFIGDKIEVGGEVVGKSEATKMITIKTSITNISGKKLIDGEAKIQMREENVN